MSYDFSDQKVITELENACYQAVKDGKTFDIDSFPAAEYRYFDRLYKILFKFHSEVNGKSGQEVMEVTMRYAPLKKKIKDDYMKDYVGVSGVENMKKKANEIYIKEKYLCDSLCASNNILNDEAKCALKEMMDYNMRLKR